jgi:DNA-binding winged helix-turn-helix (wHTH) protein
MGFKLAPVLDDQIDSGLNSIPGIALGDRDRQELSAVVALFESTIRPLGNGDRPVQLKEAEWEGSTNYQVALVPVGDMLNQASRRTRTPVEVKPVLVLPLTWRELVVRLRGVVGPSGPGQESNGARFGDVFVDFSAMEVIRSGERLTLTTMEFKLLRFLVQNARRVISREELLNEVWGYDNYPCTRTVDNHILRLRQKLELDPARPVHFHTVHGVGYKFVLEASRVLAEQNM